MSEPKRPRRKWAGKADEQSAVYANRRRVTGNYGKKLLRKRGELLERSFAHCYETGAMRRVHLRGCENVLKRQLIHVGAFNLSLILRTILGAGTPRELRNRHLTLSSVICAFVGLLRLANPSHTSSVATHRVRGRKSVETWRHRRCRKSRGCATDC